MKALLPLIHRALACIALIAYSPDALAQMNLDLKMARRNFLFDEPTQISLVISNSSGRELVFQDTATHPWDDFPFPKALCRLCCGRLLGHHQAKICR